MSTARSPLQNSNTPTRVLYAALTRRVLSLLRGQRENDHCPNTARAKGGHLRMIISRNIKQRGYRLIAVASVARRS